MRLPIIALALALAAGCRLAVACPASYVHNLGEKAIEAGDSKLHERLADEYIANRKGGKPGSTRASFIRPYIVGTSTLEFTRGPHGFRMSPETYAQCLGVALGKYDGLPYDPNVAPGRGGHGWEDPDEHFNRHFAHGYQDAEAASAFEGGPTGEGG